MKFLLSLPLKKIAKTALLLGAVIIFLFLTALPVLAADIFKQMNDGFQTATKFAYGGGNNVTVNQTTFVYSLMTALNQLLTFLAVLFLLGMIYAGFLWFNAKGNAEEVEKAKKIMKELVIGLLIVFLARVLTEFILSQIGGALTK